MCEVHILLPLAGAEGAEIWCVQCVRCTERAPRLGHRWKATKKPKCEVLGWWASWFLMLQRPKLFMDWLILQLSTITEGRSGSLLKWGAIHRALRGYYTLKGVMLSAQSTHLDASLDDASFSFYAFYVFDKHLISSLSTFFPHHDFEVMLW